MTQGLVSIVNGGKVVMKIVAGCDGYNAPKVAGEIVKRWPCSASQAYDIARHAPFGSNESLVVMTDNAIIFDGDICDLGPLYRSTFDDPKFNPRWEIGTAEYSITVEVESLTPVPLTTRDER